MSEAESRRPASLIVVDPGGHRARMEISPVPFRIGRQADNDLIIRDSRASRNHARILVEQGQYIIEDANSRHGVWVNGKRITRHALANSDSVEFGFADSYRLIFALDGAELNRLMEQLASQDKPATALGVGGNLPKLRAILEVARTLQTAFSMQDVLHAVVDAALAITGAERGFLLLRAGDELEVRVARARSGARLGEDDLRIPRRVILRALQQRRELLSMNFDPQAAGGLRPEQSIADLELRSCVCVPLVRICAAVPQVTSVLSTGSETVGALYMDSRGSVADLTGGNRELLQSLAIEASTVLENARLLEEERDKQKIEEELDLARSIQQSLLPRQLPSDGWFRACGSSVPSHQVGGDYYDVLRVNDDCWSAVVTDVSGKGVSSALLASLLQGAFLTVPEHSSGMEQSMARINRFLNERTGGEKYATVFYATLDRRGTLAYVNAGHCAPIVVRPDGQLTSLDPTAMPVGLIDPAEFPAAQVTLAPGDKLVIYTDGVTEAQCRAGEFFGRRRLREVLRENAGVSCQELHERILAAVMAFTDQAPQGDDLTLLVLEYGE